MAAVGLTDAKLQGLKAPATGRIELSDTMVPGLRVRLGTSGVKTFIVRKRVGGALRNITVGRYGPRFTLADARRKARSLLSDIEAGGDPTPRNAKKAIQGVATVRSLIPEYLAAKAEKRSVGEMKRVLEGYVAPVLGDRLAEAITRADVTRLIDEIAEKAPVMARNVHAQLSAFYTWAMPRLDRLPSNPCRDAGRPGAPKARKRVLTELELATLWGAARAEVLPWRPALQLLILTGQRREEVFSADWTEFDLDAELWTIPAERAKNGVEHSVPLAGAALKVLNGVAKVEGSLKLFPARGRPENGPSGFSKTQARLRQALEEQLGIVPHWQLHDVRRTVATGMQRLGIRLEVTEAVLNHISGSRAGIAGVYQRHHFQDEKRHALKAWATELDRIVTRENSVTSAVQIGEDVRDIPHLPAEAGQNADYAILP